MRVRFLEYLIKKSVPWLQVLYVFKWCVKDVLVSVLCVLRVDLGTLEL